MYHLLYPHSLGSSPPIRLTWDSLELEANALNLETGSFVKVWGSKSVKRTDSEEAEHMAVSELQHVWLLRSYSFVVYF